jgi:hypothetical protein
MATLTINEAVAETLDAIGDDPDYAPARLLLIRAEHALNDGTTAEVAALLNQALEEIDAACPL